MSDGTETLESLLKWCKSGDRVSSKPQAWNDLYGKLIGKLQKPSGGWEPPLQLILAAWHDTTATEKRARFREHLEWANRRGQLDEIGAFVRLLPETSWAHFGEM